MQIKLKNLMSPIFLLIVLSIWTISGSMMIKESLATSKGYLTNPKDDKFWVVGNYVPDEAFVELAKDPTNIEKARTYILRNHLKNEIVMKMNSTLEKAAQEMMNTDHLPEHYRSRADIKTSSRNVELLFKDMPYSGLEDYSNNLRFDLYVKNNCKKCNEMINKLSGGIKVNILSKEKILDLKITNKNTNFLFLSDPARVDSVVQDSLFPTLLVVNEATGKGLIFKGVPTQEKIENDLKKLTSINN